MPVPHKRAIRLPRETMTGKQLTAGSGVAHETLWGQEWHGTNAVDHLEFTLQHLRKTARTIGRQQLRRQRGELYATVTEILTALAAQRNPQRPYNELGTLFHSYPEKQQEILERLRAIQEATRPRSK